MFTTSNGFMTQHQNALKNIDMESECQDRRSTEFNPASEMCKTVGQFLDEFMLVEYKVKDHIVAREHYRQVFDLLIPEYFTSQVEK